MVKSNGLLPTLTEILEHRETPQKEVRSPAKECVESSLAAQCRAEREWYSAIAAVEDLLLERLNPPCDESCQGIVLCSPAPFFSPRSFPLRLKTGVFTSEAFSSLLKQQFQLPAAETPTSIESLPQTTEYPLLPIDPLATEQFCLILTQKFSFVMVLGEDATNTPTFQFSFDPDTIHQAWITLRSRLFLTNPHQIQPLEAAIGQFSPLHPDYKLVAQFTRHLLRHLTDRPVPRPQQAITPNKQTSSFNTTRTANAVKVSNPITEIQEESLPELELLQALTHEIRTPLTTIRMLTRVLLKQRCNLNADVVKRLEIIDQECTEQIRRMELIFRAAEMETAPLNRENLQLIPISLEQVFQQNIPHWQKQAKRRNISLDFLLPEKLPTILSNPGMFDQVLTGLMESLTRSLPAGGQIRVQVTTAGHQLKLQLLSQDTTLTNSLKSMGQLLMFQPETGNLSLNLDVTKNLFNALGGKLIVRQRPQQGEELTIFLPLGNSGGEASQPIFVQQI
ncbi:sensor histidine kinase [Lusitaniella coriacea]|uniref:sensor histidine kinase n=1 Tax=Lusitaniella coriacea TaxID=1983105 RepID=UPI003CE6C72E